MANNRKLQAELDRTLKKVDEGINIFNDIWDKVYSASNQSQKEKYETDLKKEIKKLQRVREVLKNWMTGNEFKDKSKIQVAKKRIERKMEEFKVCERETKTKAYSREGLAKAGKLDPEEKKRLASRSWIQKIIDELKLKIESCEFTIEESGDAEEIADLHSKVETHNWHILKLEMITRALDNEMVNPDEVNKIKEDIDDYLEFCDEMNYYHDDLIYEGLNIDKEFIAEKPEVTEVIQIPPPKEKKKKKSKKKKKNTDAASKDSKGLSAHEKLLEQQKERLKLLAKEEERRKELKQKEQEAQSNSTKNFSSVFTKPAVPVVEREPIQQKPTPVIPKVKQPTVSVTSPIHSPKQAIISEPHTPTIEPTKVELNINVLDIPTQNMFLESSYLHAPTDIDANEEYRYKPEKPVKVPDCFHKVIEEPPQSPKLFETFELDTLFLIFYHQRGTYQQYLAARELKKRSWYFYKKTSSWFLRNEEPVSKEKEFEVGTYEFFDCSKTWTKVIKPNFKLEYKYLENELII